jgi:hypothetical protein
LNSYCCCTPPCGQDHFAHGHHAARFKEHVFGTAQADAFIPEGQRHAAIGRRLDIGAHFHAAVLVDPLHQRAEIADRFPLDHRHFTGHLQPGAAVKRDEIAFRQRRHPCNGPTSDVSVNA